MKIRPIFAWHDLWVGCFIDRPKRRLYVFPFPCLGIMVEFDPPAGTIVGIDLTDPRQAFALVQRKGYVERFPVPTSSDESSVTFGVPAGQSGTLEVRDDGQT